MANVSTGGNLPAVKKTMTTGGNAPATQAPVPTVAGQQIPLYGQNYVAQPTGGTNFIPLPGQTPTAGITNYLSPTGTAGISNYNPAAATAGLNGYVQNQAPQVQDPNQSGANVQGNLNDLLSSQNAYIENARLRGLEQASMSGLRNSSIAAGASQRSAIEGAMPILSEIQNLNSQREGMQFTGQQNQLDRNLQDRSQQNQLAFTGQQNQFDRGLQDRTNQNSLASNAQQNQYDRALSNVTQQSQQAFAGQQAGFDRQLTANQMQNQMQFTAGQAQLDRTQGVNNTILDAQVAQNKALQDYQFQSYLQGDEAKMQDWLAGNNYTRQINAAIANTQINTVADLSNMINQYAVDNPEVYTPSVVSGLQNFLSGNFLKTMQQYFPNTVGG